MIGSERAGLLMRVAASSAPEHRQIEAIDRYSSSTHAMSRAMTTRRAPSDGAFGSPAGS
jgi:hypothetical protein